MHESVIIGGEPPKHQAPIQASPGAQGDGSATALTVELALRLQTTLELPQLIELFSTRVAAAVDHDGITYAEADGGEVQVQLGKRSRHSGSYRLMLGSRDLGELTFYRARAFTPRELERLEYLLGSLLYPLRNALMYRDALQTAHTDPLTGIGNRSALDQQLGREISLARRHQQPMALLVLDIDHFKEINDTHGHLVGDCVLRDVARIAADCIRASDMVFRYGGEEFVFLLSNTECSGARLLAERIRRTLAEHAFSYLGASGHITASIGVACLAADEDADSLFRRADSALYAAKEAGRNRVFFHGQAPDAG